MQDFPDELEKRLDQKDARLFQNIRQRLDQFNIRSDLEAVFTVLNDYKSASQSSLLPPAVGYRFADVLYDSIRMGRGIEQENDIENLRLKVQDEIVKACETPSRGDRIYDVFYRFLTQISSTRNKDAANLLLSHDVNFYTTNYDRILDTFVNVTRTKVPALANWRVENGTGPADSLHWNPYNYTNGSTMLVPLHGSIDLHTTESGVVKSSERLPELYGEKLTGDLLIFPVRGKYIFQDPFARMFKMFKQDLEMAQFVVFVGFSFNDEAIRETVASVLERRSQLERLRTGEALRAVVVGTHASTIIDEKLASHKRFVKPVDGKFEDDGTHSSVVNLLKGRWEPAG